MNIYIMKIQLGIDYEILGFNTLYTNLLLEVTFFMYKLCILS